MFYDNIVFNDLIIEKLEQLQTLKSELLNIKNNINSNFKNGNCLILVNMNAKLAERISAIDKKIDNVIDCMEKYIYEINILNNNIITNHSEISENIYVRRINEIIENDL